MYITRVFQLEKKENVQTRVPHVGKAKTKRKWNAEGKVKIGSKRKWTANSLHNERNNGKNSWENRGMYFALTKKESKLCIYLLNFDKFTTWHGVFLAAFHQRIHILHNDKGSLLQGDNTQMVIIWVTVCERAVPWPDRVLQAQWVILPFPHLKCQDTQAADSCWLAFDKWELIFNVLWHRYRKLHCKDGCLLLSKLL